MNKKIKEEVKQEEPILSAITLYKKGDNNSWVCETLKIQGDKVISRTSTTENMRIIAIEEAKIAFVRMMGIGMYE